MKPRFLVFFFFAVTLFLSCHHHKAATAYVPQQQNTATAPQQNSPTVPDDMQVTISEEMINKCITALGPISGKEGYTVLFVKDTFVWTLMNPHIRLMEGRADFVTDVNVKAGSLSYNTTAVGGVSIWYDRPKNLINVRIDSAVVDIYTKIFGTKVDIKKVNIAGKFKDPFTFEGPAASNTNMDMDMPDGSKRKIYMTTTDCDLAVHLQKIVVPCEVEFSLTPPKKQ